MAHDVSLTAFGIVMMVAKATAAIATVSDVKIEILRLKKLEGYRGTRGKIGLLATFQQSRTSIETVKPPTSVNCGSRYHVSKNTIP